MGWICLFQIRAAFLTRADDYGVSYVATFILLLVIFTADNYNKLNGDICEFTYMWCMCLSQLLRVCARVYIRMFASVGWRCVRWGNIEERYKSIVMIQCPRTSRVKRKWSVVPYLDGAALDDPVTPRAARNWRDG